MKALITILTSLLFVTLASAETDKYRLIWNDSPESSITVGWCQPSGADAKVLYRPVGSKRGFVTHEVDHKTTHLKLKSRFARLTRLEPDTLYEFTIRDRDSESPRFTFLTAPKGEASFSVVSGGDSRNHRDARQRANRAVAKIQPLFVCFGGDMISKPNAQNWADWFDDWQLTTTESGRMIPIIATRGNHEGPEDVHSFFDTPNEDDYYAVSFGDDFLRIYTLNSNIVRAGKQGKWLEKDLADHEHTKWKMAQYHHPFRPHQSKKAEQNAQYNAWAAPFFKYGMNLAIECDSHVVKRTWPVRPSQEPGNDEGFIRDDDFGTVFIGEGCWGAPLRAADDPKEWTRDRGSFNQVNWLNITPRWISARNVMVDTIDESASIDPEFPFEAPEGMKLWEPEHGEALWIFLKTKDGRPAFDPVTLTRLKIIAEEPEFTESTKVRLVVGPEFSDEGLQFRYTTDGSQPTASSTLYKEPFEVSETSVVKAAIFRDGKAVTETEAAEVKKVAASD